MFRVPLKFIFFLLVLASFVSGATHIRGGFIQITQVVDKTVTLEFVGLRDQGSSIDVGGGIFDFGDTEFIERDFDISQTPLSNEVEKVVFTVSHTYPGPGQYTVSYEEEYRNADILNIDNSINNKFYVETTFTIDPFIQNQLPTVNAFDDFYAQVGKTTSGNFKIESDKNLSSFKIVTITGKTLLESDLRNDSVSLGHNGLLNDSTYLIQFFDQQGRFIGVRRLQIVN